MFASVSFSHVLGGGALIGLAALTLFSLNGRIAGICGIAFSLLSTSLKQNLWRLLFLLGLISGALLYHTISGQPFPPPPDNKLPWLIIAGFLVGLGTSMGNGCTSGHGIAGIARFSPRSICATLVFMGSAIVTMAVIRHLI